jgi:hypothetical protein
MYFSSARAEGKAPRRRKSICIFPPVVFLSARFTGLADERFCTPGFVSMVLTYFFAPMDMLVTDNLGKVPKNTMRKLNRVALAYMAFGLVVCLYRKRCLKHYARVAAVVGSRFIMGVINIYFAAGCCADSPEVRQ